ncbi:metallophosphoesterase [Bowmanella denitrificans]|uniref:Metallophosphoesterase n=1 Tax=Bowmanella denitrificans TaxID=366582 RepID=A0ABP3H8D8_9ALTE
MYKQALYPGLLALLAKAALMISSPAWADTQAFTLAVIADCQYADKDNKGERLYRSCPDKLQQAVQDINRHQTKGTLHLGDFIDQDFDSYARLKAITANSKTPFYHVLGNHEFDVAEQYKGLITQTLDMPDRYYQFDIGQWRFITLDGNDVSHHGWPSDSARHQQNLALIAKQYALGATWNGAIGEDQLNWLDGQLQQATDEQKKVVLLCHFPLYPADPHQLWNHQQVMAVISRYPVVKAWFNGHNHKGDYGRHNGIHFVTFHAMLDTPQTAYSLVEFTDNAIHIKGKGRQPDLQLRLD